jgi:hypothetical protein
MATRTMSSRTSGGIAATKRVAQPVRLYRSDSMATVSRGRRGAAHVGGSPAATRSQRAVGAMPGLAAFPATAPRFGDALGDPGSVGDGHGSWWKPTRSIPACY